MRRTLTLYFYVLVFMFGAALPAFAQNLPDASSVLDFIGQHPDDVAVLCYTPGEDPAVDHQADEPFPLASTYKLVILAEFAQQVDAGLLDPTEEVSLSDMNAYWLPTTDGNAHQAFLDSLADRQDTLTLQDIADGMIQFSSNAAADYLLSRLGTDDFPAIFDLLGIENTDLPAGTYLGLYLAYDNHETGELDPDNVDVDTLASERQRLENLFLTDEDWHVAEVSYVQQRLDENQQLADDQDYDSLIVEYDRQVTYFSSFGAKGSARDMTLILEAAYRGDTLSETAKTVMQSSLDWLMEINPANRAVYDILATKGGTWPAVLTAVWYVDPKEREFWIRWDNFQRSDKLLITKIKKGVPR